MPNTIKKTILHLKDNPNVDVYPKTSFDQIEGLLIYEHRVEYEGVIKNYSTGLYVYFYINFSYYSNNNVKPHNIPEFVHSVNDFALYGFRVNGKLRFDNGDNTYTDYQIYKIMVSIDEDDNYNITIYYFTNENNNDYSELYTAIDATNIQGTGYGITEDSYYEDVVNLYN